MGAKKKREPIITKGNFFFFLPLRKNLLNTAMHYVHLCKILLFFFFSGSILWHCLDRCTHPKAPLLLMSYRWQHTKIWYVCTTDGGRGGTLGVGSQQFGKAKLMWLADVANIYLFVTIMDLQSANLFRSALQTDSFKNFFW